MNDQTKREAGSYLLAAVEKARGHQGPPEHPVAFDSPPFAPDRPGRYLLWNGRTITLWFRQASGVWSGYGDVSPYICFSDGTTHSLEFDIIARAPDDQEWCLAQARALLAGAPGFVIVPVEPTEAMKIAGDHASFWCGDKWRAMLKAAEEKGS